MSTDSLFQSKSRLKSATQSLIPLHTSSIVYPRSSQVVYTPSTFLPAIQPVETRITVVAVVASLSLILLITCILAILLYFIAVRMRTERLKRYSNFPREAVTPIERETELIQRDSKYNPIYVSDNIRDSLSNEFLQKLLTAISTGKNVRASQDYFEPGRERDGPLFFKGEQILILKIEEEVHKGQTTVWLRGEANGREVFFPSYIINLMENLEDTFDTLSSPVRNMPPIDELATQDSAVSMDSAPAELESLFHDVDYSYLPHSIALPRLSGQELAKQRRASHSDILHCEKPIKRPTRLPPAPPSKPTYPVPRVPSKLNRPKLSSQKAGCKDTKELLFVPPPLSSSTPLRHPEPKPRPKRISGLVPYRTRRPDTPDTKAQPKSKKIPSWVTPPSRPDPPYTPSTLSLLLYAAAPDAAPDKPPPPSSYEIESKLI